MQIAYLFNACGRQQTVCSYIVTAANSRMFRLVQIPHRPRSLADWLVFQVGSQREGMEITERHDGLSGAFSDG
jgi:hypothetical protein